ncbi:MAG: PIN domain-containing protein [Nanoarchaeota archaeon]
MELVIDATILFSGLIGKGVTKEIIFLESVELYCPEALYKEIGEHQSRIRLISKLPSGDLEFLLNKLKAKIKTFPLARYELFLKQSNILIPDPEDTEYLALSLALDKCPIWSEDPHFKKQALVKVFTTKELVKFLKSKKLF